MFRAIINHFIFLTIATFLISVPAFAAEPSITNFSNGSTISTTQEINFSNNGTDLKEWWIYVGTSAGTYNLGHSGRLDGSATSYTFKNLTQGTAYVTLFYKNSSRKWIKNNSLKVTIGKAGTSTEPAITNFNNGSTISTSQKMTFSKNNTVIKNWWIYVGTSAGAYNLGSSGRIAGSATSYTFNSLASGPGYVTLWYKNILGKWKKAQTLSVKVANDEFTVISNEVTSINENDVMVKFRLSDVGTGHIEYGRTKNLGSFNVKDTSFKFRVHNQAIKNLNHSTTYYYRIHSSNKAGKKITSNIGTFKTKPKVTPNNFKVLSHKLTSVKHDMVTIQFSLNDFGTSRIEYGTTKNLGSFNTKGTSYYSKVHNQNINNLIPSTTYYYRIHASHSPDKKAVSTIGTFKTKPKVTLDNFKVLSHKITTVTEDSAVIKFALSDFGTGQMEYGKTKNLGSFNVKDNSLKSKVHTQTLNKLEPSTTYYCRAHSINKSGKKIVSAIGTFKTKAKQPQTNTRISSLLDLRFGFGKDTIGGANGVMTEITSLKDASLYKALTDDTARWIYFHPSIHGQTWNVPAGSIALGANKTVDGRGASITWQYGIPNNDIDITLDPIRKPKTGQLNATKGQFIMVGITHVGDLGWPYAYKKPWFKNGATDGLEIWRGSHYWIHDNTWKRMSDESLGVYHIGGTPDLITFSNNKFIETKTGSLIGAQGKLKRGRVTIAYNHYTTMVNGRSPGTFRNMDAHVFNNIVEYVNDEGMRVGVNARVVSESNVFDMGCNPGISGPRVIRYVLPAEKPHGILHSHGDIVAANSKSCPNTFDEGFITAPAARPFNIPYEYNLFKTRNEIINYNK